MPRRMRSLTAAAPTKQAVVASSAVVHGPNKTSKTIYQTSQEWQKECYRHYGICGEARFAAQFFGHALSKAVIHPVTDPYDRRSAALTEGPAVDATNALFGIGNGPDLKTAFGVHLTVAGECYLIGRHDEKHRGEDYLWEIRSVLEVRSDGMGQTWWIDQPGEQPPRIDIAEDEHVIRIWLPDPAQAGKADSPFKSLLPILEEIEWLTRYVFAQCSSRLAGAGLAIFPEEIDFPAPPDAPNSDGTEDRSKVDDLMALLADWMLAPITDPGDFRAKVPGVMTAPGEFIDQIKWLTFWSELDTEAKGLRQEAIQRFALGMDLPPERILGMSAGAGASGQAGSRGVSHWGAWQIDEDTIKMHVEPMLDVICATLSVDYLRDIMDVDGALGYDTSLLRLRPDRSQEAITLYNLGLLRGEIVVRENGFDPDTDMMGPEELKTWLVAKVAVGSATPDMVAGALNLLGVKLPMVDVPDSQGQNNEARPAPALPPEQRPLPEQAASLHACYAACDALVFRALERAGNRIRQIIRDAGGPKPQASSYEVHTVAPAPPKSAAKLLEDAWTCAPQVLAGAGLDPDAVLPHVEAYTLSLLTSGQPHTREGMERYLESQL